MKPTTPPVNAHITALIRKHIYSTLTEEEMQELENWLAVNESNRELFRRTSAFLASDTLATAPPPKNKKPLLTILLIAGTIIVITMVTVHLINPQRQKTALPVVPTNKPSKKFYVAPGIAVTDSLMQFKKVTIKGIMGAISYYYKLPVVYKGTISDETYTATISTPADVKEVVEILNQVGIKVSFNGKELTVTE